jgi:hypothetical protein
LHSARSADTCRCGSGIERRKPRRAERQLPPDPPRGGQSERTVKSYTAAVRLFADFLAERGHPLTVDAITRDDVRYSCPWTSRDRACGPQAPPPRQASSLRRQWPYETHRSSIGKPRCRHGGLETAMVHVRLTPPLTGVGLPGCVRFRAEGRSSCGSGPCRCRRPR